VSAPSPKTEKRLCEAGISTRRIDISEIEKADGSLTSLSLILESRSTPAPVNDVELRRIQVGDAPAPTGHSSQAIAHGGLVFVSPQPPFDLASNRSHRLLPDEQTEQAIHNLSVILAASGSSLARVVRTTIHVADPKQIPQVEATYQRIFGAHRPARSVIVNSALPAGVLVEIEAVAAVAGELAYRP
jgi:reactive intermediate/imine deaminase